MKVSSIQPTPNPNAFKFLVDQPMAKAGQTKAYAKPEQARNDVLAQGLFAIPGIETLFFCDNFVTVSMTAEADWRAVAEQVEPWYRSSVDSGRSARRALARAKAIGEGEDVPEESSEERKRSILREGLSPATRTDAVVWRAFCRTMNLLAPPTHLLEPDVGARVMRVWQDRANRPPEPPLGPPREEMLAAVGVA